MITSALKSKLNEDRDHTEINEAKYDYRNNVMNRSIDPIDPIGGESFLYYFYFSSFSTFCCRHALTINLIKENETLEIFSQRCENLYAILKRYVGRFQRYLKQNRKN